MFGIEEIKNGCLNINGTTNVINGSWEITMPDYMQKEQGVDLFMASLGKSPCPTGCTWEITCSDCLDQGLFMASLKMENNCNIFPLLQNSMYKLSVTEKKPRPDPGADKKSTQQDTVSPSGMVHKQGTVDLLINVIRMSKYWSLLVEFQIGQCILLFFK